MCGGYHEGKLAVAGTSTSILVAHLQKFDSSSHCRYSDRGVPLMLQAFARPSRALLGIYLLGCLEGILEAT